MCWVLPRAECMDEQWYSWDWTFRCGSGAGITLSLARGFRRLASPTLK